MTQVGARIGAYEIVAPLGAGGMGEVYRARDTKLGREVAIKILPAALANDRDRLARFEREARVLASLNHPHIAQIYGLEGLERRDGVDGQAGEVPQVGPAERIPAIVMELVDGETLADRIRRGPLKVSDALVMARQIAEALDAAHERGIVHRDLKPSNIALTRDDQVKILDFGLAKDATADGRVGELTHSPTMLGPTMAGVLLGTAPYMSPEQARGKSVDKRTDIWAFGCVLYEMLTGRRAFGGETTTDTVAAILEREPDWNALPLHLPAVVVHLIRHTLRKEPSRRLRDIGDAVSILAGDYAQEINGIGPSQYRRAGPALAWGATAAVLALAIVGLVSWQRLRAPRPPSVARLIKLTSGPALDHSPVISPDGKWVAYLSNARGPTDVWVKFITGGDPVNLTASLNLEVAPQSDSGGISVSPDGAQIAFNAGPRGATQGAIGTWVVPAPLGGTPRRLLETGRGARWSPDGRRLVFIVQGGSGGDAVWIADADGANPKEISPRRAGWHQHWAAWSPDSRYIYLIYSAAGVANAEPSSIYRIPADGGTLEPVVRTARRAIFPALTPDGGGLIYSANPFSVDMGLWWRPLGGDDLSAQHLTMGTGEFAESNLSSDGTRLVATLYDNRQALVTLSVNAATTDGGAHPITNGATGDIDPALSPDNTRLVFSSARSGGRSLWTARPDASESRPLTTGDAIDERPVFSPDGRWIAFLSDRGGERGIWLINSEGGSPRPLVKAHVLDTMSWSPDSTRIVYSESGETAPRLVLVQVADGTSRPLATPGPAAGPAWSPKEDLIAYVETVARANAPTVTRVLFVDSSGRPRELSTFQPPNSGNATLAWAPGGRELAVVGNSGSVRSDVWVVEPGRPAASRKLAEFPADTRIRGAVWADAGSLIVGRQQRDADIVLLDLRR